MFSRIRPEITNWLLSNTSPCLRMVGVAGRTKILYVHEGDSVLALASRAANTHLATWNQGWRGMRYFSFPGLIKQCRPRAGEYLSHVARPAILVKTDFAVSTVLIVQVQIPLLHTIFA